MSAEALKRELLAISKRADNLHCADCKLQGPTWASFNLGIFLCMNCAGCHRSLGTHITRVRSINLDLWDQASVDLMSNVGNAKSNAYYEAKLQPHQRIQAHIDNNLRMEFIRAKYERRNFYGEPSAAALSAASSSSSAAASETELSRAEKRAARLAARAAQNSTSTATPATQTTTPIVPSISHTTHHTPAPIAVPSTTSFTHADLFAGLTPSPAVAASPTSAHTPHHSSTPTAPYASPTTTNDQTSLFPIASTSSTTTANGGGGGGGPAAAAAAARKPRVTSASPWVTREQFSGSSTAVSSSTPNNNDLLNLSASPTPAPSNVAASLPVQTTQNTIGTLSNLDDMFAGLSVSQPSSVSGHATSTDSNSSSLLNFYQQQQNPGQSSPATDLFSGLEAKEPSPSESSGFDFLQASSTTSSGGFDFIATDATSTTPVDSSSTSAFGFLDSSAATTTTTTSNTTNTSISAPRSRLTEDDDPFKHLLEGGGQSASASVSSTSGASSASTASATSAFSMNGDPFGHLSIPETSPPAYLSDHATITKDSKLCDVRDCTRSKVSHGLCSLHISELGAAASNARQSGQSTFTALDGGSFDLHTSQLPLEHPPVFESNNSSSFAFLDAPATTGGASSSSAFGFM